MKLLFSFYMHSGGMGTLNRIRSEALTRQGHSCKLLYTTQDRGAAPDWLESTLAAGSFDAVTVSSDYTMLEKIRMAGYNGLLIYEVQGYGPPAEGQKVIVPASGYIRRFADAVLYPKTPHLANLFQTHVPEVPQYSFDNPVDSSLIRYRSYPRKPFPIIGWIGRVEYNKNWPELLELTNLLTRDYPNLHVWMFGDNELDNEWEYSQFAKKVDAYGLAPRIIRHSKVPYQLMPDYLSVIGDSGGFLCSTSMLEGFGYAVCEAMLCRCPVLASASDGVSRMIIPNKTGLLYSGGDVEEAYRNARLLMEDIPLRNRIARAGQQHVRRRFRREKYVANFEDMVADLAKRVKRNSR